MRNTFAETFYEAGQNDERLCLVVADISPAGAIDKFRTRFPDRFVNTGVAEQIGGISGELQSATIFIDQINGNPIIREKAFHLSRK